MPLSTGKGLGPYEILSSIGAGGMGEVYRARDTKLTRDVAIKVLPEAFAHDAERMARFEREARVLASLNHPNIATIHGLEESNGVRALVMELVEGPTLAERIAQQGPLPLDEALALARQIADGLEYAHERGVIHRDLKPANIKVTPDGTVKLLDFGLAKAVEEPIPQGNPSISPTLTMESTRAGVILGTAAYMSPEQVRGKVVDKRADIWAFGCVLLEILTGKQAFSGETTSDVLAAVLSKEPDLGEAPKYLRPIVEKCLRRDPKVRWRDIGDVRIALSEANPVIDVHSRTAWPGIPWLIAGVFAIGLAMLGVIHFREKAADSPVLRFSVSPPERASLSFPALSPDGRRLAFATTVEGKSQLWVRSLDELTAKPLVGTEGGSVPFWSPDSRFIGFFTDNKLRKIDASGGPVLTLCDAPDGAWGTWSKGGLIVFGSRARPLYEVSAAGGVSTPVTIFDQTRRETYHTFPWFLPDGQHFLYVAVSGGVDVGIAALRIASAQSLSRDSKVVMEVSSNVAFAQGHLVFVRDGTLMAQPFDLNRLITTGEASPLVDNIRIWRRLAGMFSVSETGLLVYQTGGADRYPLVWFDRNGKQVGIVGESGFFNHPYLSPDGKRAVLSVIDPTTRNSDIWVFDLFRTLRTRFTFDPAEESSAIWSPDGATIVFNSRRRGHLDLYQKPTNGVGVEELLYADGLEKTPWSWSPDGRFLLYAAADPKTKNTFNLWVLPVPKSASTERKPFVLVEGGGQGQFSPDGRWVAYTCADASQRDICLISFPAQGSKRQISTAGGVQPRWRRDGLELFYIAPDQRLMAVEVNLKASGLDIAAAHPLFGPLQMGSGIQYDVSADGQRFLAVAPLEANSDVPLTVVQNWLATLKR